LSGCCAGCPVVTRGHAVGPFEAAERWLASAKPHRAALGPALDVRKACRPLSAANQALVRNCSQQWVGPLEDAPLPT